MKNLLIQKGKHLLILLVILIILLVLFFLFLKSNKPSGSPSTSQSKIYQPNINVNYSGKFPIEISLTESNLDLPNKLTVYKASDQKLSEKDVLTLAKSFGFNSKPLVVEDAVFGTTYIFSSKNGNLRVIADKKIIDLKTNDYVDNVFIRIPDDKELETLAVAYLIDKAIIKDKTDIEVYKIKKLKIGLNGHIVENAKPNEINAATISFNKKVNNYPIIASTYETGIISVTFNNKLAISSVYVNTIPELINLGDFSLKNFDEINKSLSSAVLQSLDDGKIELIDINSTFVTKATIDKIGIVYLRGYNKLDELIQPIYILKGNAVISGNKTVPVELSMPALSSTNNF